jgi:ElaB/YqjD/DUF883 family membrane-anchored ribosome-binding protein
MASEPIPEPLTNQSVDNEREPRFGPSPTRIPDNAEPLNAVEGSQRTNGQGHTEKQGIHRVAESVGTAVGNIVNRARELSDDGENTVVGWKESTKNKVTEVKRQTAQALDAAQQTASVGFQQAKEQASETLETARLNASAKIRKARVRAWILVHDYPLQIIAASAALGLISGVLLRMWRSSRYE